MTIQWTEISEDNLINLEMAMELYDQAFPIQVREPHSVFLRSLQYAKTRRPNNYHFLMGLEGDQLVSFATGHYFADVNSGFIVYLVTNPIVRSKGLGSKTLVELESLLFQDAISAGNASLKAILLETETQDIVHTEGEKEDCIKRNRFFARNNYEMCDEIRYLQPSLHNEVEDIPLNLFIKNFDTSKQRKEEIQKAISAIYKEKYSFINKIDKEALNNSLKRWN